MHTGGKADSAIADRLPARVARQLEEQQILPEILGRLMFYRLAGLAVPLQTAVRAVQVVRCRTMERSAVFQGQVVVVVEHSAMVGPDRQAE